MTADQDASAVKLLAKYRRIVASKCGNSFREVADVREYNLPSLGDGEVLIRIEFVGINGGCETFRARGEHMFKANKGQTDFPLGAEGVGTVVELGASVKTLKVGQAVAVTGATYAEFSKAQESKCFPIRESSAEAVAICLSGTTAAGALLFKGDVKAGETVLVTAAAGGTGHLAAQIAKLKGCRVIATCGSQEKANKLSSIGVDRVINYRHEDVAQVLAKEFPKQIDVAYEGVGGKLRDAVLANLAPKGRVLAVGYISEYPHNQKRASENGSDQEDRALYSHDWQLPPPETLFWESKTIHNGDKVFYGQVWPENMQQLAEAKQWLFDAFYEGKIQAWTHTFKGLESVVKATEYMLSGESLGKVVVDLR